MRSLTIALLKVLILTVYSCSRPILEKVPGTYYRHWQNEYSIADDTLICRPLDRAKERFRIEKHTGYQVLREGKVRPKKIKITRWIATWDEKNQVLSEGPGGRQLAFAGDSLLLGEHAYRRLP